MLIAKRYKQNIKINKLKTPEDAANIVIKDTKHFDVNSEKYVEGSQQEQEEAQKKLDDVTTNLSGEWKDMPDIKQNLWNKLHGISTGIKKNVSKEMNNLA